MVKKKKAMPPKKKKAEMIEVTLCPHCHQPLGIGEHLPIVTRLNRDVIQLARTMTEKQARVLVDFFYMSQDDRKRAHNQLRTMTEEPHEHVTWLATQSQMLEDTVKKSLTEFTDAHPIGEWLKSIDGVGPILAAGLIAHLAHKDEKVPPTVGNWYSFAGVAGKDQKQWKKGKKRPFNASLKTLLWKCGQSFKYRCNEENCLYGHEYKARKKYEEDRNARGYNKERAAHILKTKDIDEDTDAYKAYSKGIFPPAHLDSMALRHAYKMLLSHVHCVLHWRAYGRLPANPFALDHLGHTHFKVMPNPEMIPGLKEALQKKGLI